jgi:hypothetical protein
VNQAQLAVLQITLRAERFTDEVRGHDWRYHVPSQAKAAWPLLSDDVRLTLFFLAQAAADREQGDA